MQSRPSLRLRRRSLRRANYLHAREFRIIPTSLTSSCQAGESPCCARFFTPPPPPPLRPSRPPSSAAAITPALLVLLRVATPPPRGPPPLPLASGFKGEGLWAGEPGGAMLRPASRKGCAYESGRGWRRGTFTINTVTAPAIMTRIDDLTLVQIPPTSPRILGPHHPSIHSNQANRCD